MHLAPDEEVANNLALKDNQHLNQAIEELDKHLKEI